MTPTYKREEDLRRKLIREYFENACAIVALKELAARTSSTPSIDEPRPREQAARASLDPTRG